MDTLQQTGMKRSAIAVAVALTLMTGAAPAFAKEKPAKTPGTTQTISVWGDPVMENLAAYSGRALVRHLRTVKAYLANGDISQARGELQNSRDFASAIRLMMPYVAVVDQINNAKTHLAEDQVDMFYSDLLPIYGNLNDMQVYAPKLAAKARAGVKRAERSARAGNKKVAAEALKDVANDITTTTVYMPVRLVASEIRVAQRALDEKKPDTATAVRAVDGALASLTTVVHQFAYSPQKA